MFIIKKNNFEMKSLTQTINERGRHVYSKEDFLFELHRIEDVIEESECNTWRLSVSKGNYVYPSEFEKVEIDENIGELIFGA